ncbi:Cof-type HAD-IIB family hydrolase [Acetobacter estunensis]|uniref:Cof-type HAD-IIB family hydrolase n=1 Tax=Acetobacter estunensis TaxID=104097 RepID=UPI001C2D1787|nr:Cof-type HAD-IIB family hydrolase [Acetobacter estunensis]MBV1838086.1 Cof-type HAD-IIB family hydrolase [Acetobacter estunensis]
MRTDEEARHDAKAPPTDVVRLVVSDMDGTLLTPHKQVTQATVKAIARLREAGVAVCLVSSRAMPGVTRYLDALKLETPCAALNGALIHDAQGRTLSSLTLPKDAVQETLDMFSVHDVEPWLFVGTDWIVRDATTGYAPQEAKTLGITPKVVSDFGPFEDKVGKLTGSSADYDLLIRQEAEIGELLAGRASVARSADYYLDITPLEANKGHALRELGKLMDVPLHEIACLGDMPNDIPMLDIAGLAIAMGNATDEVASHAHVITDTNENEGWAKAVETFILPRVPGATMT